MRSSIVVALCFFYGDGDHLNLHVLTHSFPTRRSSDLAANLPVWQEQVLLVDTLDVVIEDYQYNADLLSCSQGEEQSAVLVSHLLRSRCPVTDQPDWRSEEHTSELQSLMRISYAVLCWKKKR